MVKTHIQEHFAVAHYVAVGEDMDLKPLDFLLALKLKMFGKEKTQIFQIRLRHNENTLN